MNGPGNHIISELPDAGGVRQRGDSNGNGQTDNKINDIRYRQGKGGDSSQPKHYSTLGTWSQAVNQAVQDMSAA